MIDGQKAPCDEGVIDAAGRAAPCPPRDRPWVLAATILGSSLAFITGSVVNVALPAIQEALGASAADMQWVVNGYLLFLGALILVGGAAGDRYGRRRIFAVGTAVFTAASVGCGFAPTVEWLVGLRAVQGIGGAMLVPGSLSLISASFPKAERGAAIGTWAGFSALTTAVGPLVGGSLVDAGSWRWVFFVVVPFALVCLGVTVWRVPESRDPDAKALDGVGAALVTLGLGALVYGLIAAGAAGWTAPRVLLALGGGLAGLFAFLGWEARHPTPMMPPALFRVPAFSGANLMTLLLYCALNGALFFLPFNLMQVQGYSATAAGAAFLPFTILVGGLSRWAGGLVDRVGPRVPLVGGPLVAGLGFGLLAGPAIGGSYWTTYFPGLAVAGLGMAVSVAPLTTVVMNAAGDENAGVASGVNNAAARVAGLLAIAVLGTVAVGLFSTALEARLAAVEAPDALKTAVWTARHDLAGLTVPAEADPATRERLTGIVDQSFVWSFRWIMGIAAALGVGSAVCAALTIPGAQTHPERTRDGIRSP
jgi:EmrB/QacA subfamily drug resistance transporter